MAEEGGGVNGHFFAVSSGGKNVKRGTKKVKKIFFKSYKKEIILPPITVLVAWGRRNHHTLKAGNELMIQPKCRKI